MEILEEKNHRTHKYGEDLGDDVEKIIKPSDCKIKKTDKLNKMRLAKTTKGLYIDSIKSKKVDDINQLLRLKKIMDKKKAEVQAESSLEIAAQYLTTAHKPRRSHKMKSKMASMKDMRNLVA